MSAAVDAAVKTALHGSIDATPGAWVGIWIPDTGWYVPAYGNAAPPSAAASSADHSFIGSLTKTATATAVLQQVAAGTIALSDTVAGEPPRPMPTGMPRRDSRRERNQAPRCDPRLLE